MSSLEHVGEDGAIFYVDESAGNVHNHGKSSWGEDRQAIRSENDDKATIATTK